MIRLCPLETMITRCDVAGLRVPEVLQEKSQVVKDYHGKSAGWYILNARHVSCYDFFFCVTSFVSWTTALLLTMHATQTVKHKGTHKPLMNAHGDRMRVKKTKKNTLPIFSNF